MIQLLLLIFGLVALIKGSFKVTGGRIVSGQTGRILGVVMIAGALIPFLLPAEYGNSLSCLTFIGVVVAGLMFATEE